MIGKVKTQVTGIVLLDPLLHWSWSLWRHNTSLKWHHFCYMLS